MAAGLALMLAAAPIAQAAPGDVLWTRQFGTTAADDAFGMAVGPDGSVYVAGRTDGTLDGGGGKIGFQDAFLRKYDSAGTVLWTHQFGTTLLTEARGVAVGPDGSVYVAGLTSGALPGGGGQFGTSDAFVRKYDSAGTVLWTRQFGTTNTTHAFGVAVGPDGSVSVAGEAIGGALPGGGGQVGFTDAFVRTYDSAGTVLWTRQFGTASTDVAHGVAVGPDGSVSVAGQTNGALPGGGGPFGGNDAFVRTYDEAGTVLWTRQFGTASTDVAHGVAVGPDGSVSVAGQTNDALDGGGGHLGEADAFVATYDSAGTVLWTRQFGTTSGDVARGVAVGPDGSVSVAGVTSGALEGGGGQFGGNDAFARRYDGALVILPSLADLEVIIETVPPGVEQVPRQTAAALTYEVTVRNLGVGGGFTGVVLTIRVPGGVNVESVALSTGGACSSRGRAVTCPIGVLAPAGDVGSEATATIVIGTKGGNSLTTEASVTANEPESDLSNNGAVHTVRVVR